MQSGSGTLTQVSAIDALNCRSTLKVDDPKDVELMFNLKQTGRLPEMQLEWKGLPPSGYSNTVSEYYDEFYLSRGINRVVS